MSNTCIIFGGNSQDGLYLKEQCQKKGLNVIAVARSSGDILGDVSVYNFVLDLIKQYKPYYIFHLAATSTTRHDAILDNAQAICMGTCNILEAVKRFSPNTKIFIAGSGLQFKNSGIPISENDSFIYDTAYSTARNASIEFARYYRKIGINVYVGYLFHHESPLRKPSHVSKKIVLSVKRIAQGHEEKIELGDISIVKEWAYAGDITKGMLTLLEQDMIFEATIGTGIGYSIKDWLTECFSMLGLNWRNYVILKNNYVAEYSTLISDPKTIFSLGWRPKTDFTSLAKLMME